MNIDEKDLKKLGKSDLMELLQTAIREKQSLQTEIDKMKAVETASDLQIRDLTDRCSNLEKENAELRSQNKALQSVPQNTPGSQTTEFSDCGTLAEACLKVSGIFEAADLAAAKYLENLQKTVDEQNAMREGIIIKAQADAARIVSDAQMKADAKWYELSGKLQNFYDSHQGLREMLDKIDKLPGASIPE